jgi:hypothetical protein
MSPIDRRRRRLAYSLDEAARLGGLSGPQQLRDWVAAGLIQPMVRGGKGRGRSHYFGAQQVLGMAIVAALNQTCRGCSVAYARRVLDTFGGMTTRQLRAWLGPDNPWSQQVLERLLPKRLFYEALTGDPDEEAEGAELGRRLEPVERALRLRLFGVEDRQAVAVDEDGRPISRKGAGG